MLSIASLSNLLVNVKNAADNKEVFEKMSDAEKAKYLFQHHKVSSSNGSIFKVLNDYIVQPTIFISKDLEGTPYELEAIQAQINIFTATYIQALSILTNVNGMHAFDAITLLKTDKGEMGNAMVANGQRLLKSLDVALEDDGTRRIRKFSHRVEAIKRKDRNGVTTNNNNGNNNNNNGGVSNKDLAAGILTTSNATMEVIKQGTNKLSKDISALKGFFKNKDSEDRKSYLKSQRVNADDVLDKTISGRNPTYNYFMRHFVFKIQNVTEGKETYTEIPITVRAHIFYVDDETVASFITNSNSNSDNSFLGRWNDYRVGAISFWDLALGSSLVANYRKNLLKDTKGLLQELDSHNKNAKARLLTNLRAQGFEKYYNLFILSSNTISNLSKKIGKLSSNSDKEKFMEMLSSMQLMVLDHEFELFYLYLLHLDGESKGKLSSLAKKADENAGMNEMLKALFANTIPKI